MNDTDTESLVLHGVLRQLPPSPVVQLLRGISGWTLLVALLRWFAKWTLGLRRGATLRLHEESIEIDDETRVLGRRVRQRSVLIRVRDLAEVTLEESGQDLRWVVGMSALGGGTVVGVLLMVRGVAAAPLSPSLIALGGACLGLGAALDFWLDSGRRWRTLSGPAQLVVRATASRGWVLSQVDPSGAHHVTERLRQLCGLSPVGGPAAPDAARPAAPDR